MSIDRPLTGCSFSVLFSGKNVEGTEFTMFQRRVLKDAVTLAAIFGTVYVGALIGHGYGL